MSNYQVIVAVRDFIKQIAELHKTDQIVNNYFLLLSKIDETKSKAIDVHTKSILSFLEANKKVLLTQPLALNDYVIKWNAWNPLNSSNTFQSKCINVNLMPAFTVANQKQGLVLHCHLLKIASLVYEDNEEFDELLKKIKSNFVEFDDYEKGIIKKLFDSIREIEVGHFSKDEPEKFVDSIMQSQMAQILPMLRKPNIKWNKLFEYMFQEIEDTSKEHNIDDPILNDLLKTIKESNYDIKQVIPKLFTIVRHLNLNKYITGFSLAEQNVLSGKFGQLAVDDNTVDETDITNHLQVENYFQKQ